MSKKNPGKVRQWLRGQHEELSGNFDFGYGDLVVFGGAAAVVSVCLGMYIKEDIQKGIQDDRDRGVADVAAAARARVQTKVEDANNNLRANGYDLAPIGLTNDQAALYRQSPDYVAGDLTPGSQFQLGNGAIVNFALDPNAAHEAVQCFDVVTPDGLMGREVQVSISDIGHVYNAFVHRTSTPGGNGQVCAVSSPNDLGQLGNGIQVRIGPPTAKTQMLVASRDMGQAVPQANLGY